MELLSVSPNEDGPSKAWVPRGVATMTRRPSSKGGDHKNIMATTTVDPCPADALSPATIRSDAPQAIDLQYIFILPMHRYWASLSRSGVFRARTRTRSWRDRDVQQRNSFLWSLTRPANRLRFRHQNPIHASSIWSDCWRDRPRGTSFEPKLIAGRETAFRSKEVAS